MIYNFKEYNKNEIRVFEETSSKGQQESKIVEVIFKLLNNNKYDNIDEFIVKNNNYQHFLKYHNCNNVVKHWSPQLTEQEYVNILNSIKKMTLLKQDFEKENIKTTKIDDNEYNSFKGEDKTYIIDNSNSDSTIEEQMKKIQDTSTNFQVSDMKQNTENMFKELESRKNSFDLKYLHEINTQALNNEEKNLFEIADNYQKNSNQVIKVDLKKAVMVDEQDNIMKIQKENGKYSIKIDENAVQKKETPKQEIGYQKQLDLKPSMNTIYSN